MANTTASGTPNNLLHNKRNKVVDIMAIAYTMYQEMLKHPSKTYELVWGMNMSASILLSEVGIMPRLFPGGECG